MYVLSTSRKFGSFTGESGSSPKKEKGDSRQLSHLETTITEAGNTTQAGGVSVKGAQIVAVLRVGEISREDVRFR